MKIFGIVVLCICAIYILTSLRLPIVIIYHNLKLKKLNKFKAKKFANFYVLLPGLREQDLVESTIDHFNKMDYPLDKLHICIVTTQRENFEYEKKGVNVETTQDLTLKIIKEKQFKFETINIHYPNSVGNKASQLNFAIKQILSTKETYDNCYFAMFDFDSRPNEDYFILANNCIELNKSPDIVQSVPFFLSNIYKISKSPKSFLSVNFAMEQACRSGCIEIWNLLANSKNILPPLFPLYAMGASLIVKREALEELSYIPEPVDDLPLGFRYFINKKKFSYLPSYVLGDLPERTKLFFNQAILIQKGNVMALKEAKRQGIAKFTLWRRILVITEFLTQFCFKFLMPFVLLTYLLLNITRFNYICVLIILAPYLRFISGSLITTLFIKKKIHFLTWLISFVFAFLTPFCMGYGPIKNIILETKKKLLKKEIVYKKTE